MWSWGTVFSVFFALFGLAFTVFHDPLGRLAIAEQNRFWGFHFGEREIKGTQIGFLITGVCFLGFGILVIAGLIRFKA